MKVCTGVVAPLSTMNWVWFPSCKTRAVRRASALVSLFATAAGGQSHGTHQGRQEEKSLPHLRLHRFIRHDVSAVRANYGPRFWSGRQGRPEDHRSWCRRGGPSGPSSLSVTGG